MKANRLLIVAILFFSACAVGPDYEAPEIPTPESFGEASESLAQKAAVDELWWKSFHDPLLDELVTEAVQNNKDVRQALSRINQARAVARQSLSALLPGAKLSGSYDKSKASAARFPGDSASFEYEVYSGSLDASWEIDIFGRLRRELEARNAGYEASVASFQDSIRMVLAEVAMTYFQLRGAQAQLDIARKNTGTQEETLKLVQTKVDFGQVSELDAARAQAQLESTRAIIPPLEASVKMQMHRLAVLLGKHPKALSEKLSPVLPLPIFTGPLNVGNPVELLRRRPDLRAAERQLASETALIGVAEGELYPKLSMTGYIGFETSDFAEIGHTGNTHGFGPRLSWTPFDTGSLRAKIHQQTEKTEEVLLAYEQTVLGVLEEVENSLAQYSAEQARQVSLQKALQAATRAHGLAKAQYTEGVADFLTVLDAERAVLDNDAANVRSQQDLALRLVGIYKALGGGWENWDLHDTP